MQNPEEQLQNHTYLAGNYAPVSELLINQPVPVVAGEIPKDLDGLYCRNGPNPVYRFRRYHWFDGDAMLHNLRFQDGRAYYTNQFVPSPRYEIEKQLGESFFPTLGEYTGFWGFLKTLFHPKMVNHYVDDYRKTSAPPNTACLIYRNKYYCLNEGNVPFECRILPDGRLEAIGFEYFNNTLDYPMSAHPRVDENGDLLFHSYTVTSHIVKQSGPMKVGRFSKDFGQVVSYFCPTPEGQKHISFAHNLIFTKNFIIVYDCSVHFDPKAMFEGGSFFRTNPNYNLKFGIIPKSATSRDEVIWVDTGKPGGIVHPLNSWEEDDGTIVIWTPFCDNLVLDLEDENGINKFSMIEFRIDPNTRQITKETIDDSVNVEFSVVPQMGQFVRYGYTAIQDASTPGEGSFSGFCVWDMAKRKLHATISYDGSGGEPAVIQSTSGKSYVGAYVQKDEESFFELYDGETTNLVTSLRMPGRVPFGFHGLWVKGDELQGHFEHHDQRDISKADDSKVAILL